jgi:Rrf2 family protein
MFIFAGHLLGVRHFFYKVGKKMISTKGRYALRIMIDLASQDPDKFIPLKDIAERQNISKKYLEIIIKDLVEGDLLISLSGKGGGYKLKRKPEEYPVGEIIELTEGSLAPVACLAEKAEECPRASGCITLPLWKEYGELVHNFFYNKKLSDLVEK